MKRNFLLKNMAFFVGCTLSICSVHAQSHQPFDQARFLNIRHHALHSLSDKAVMPLTRNDMRQNKPTTLHSRMIAFTTSEYDGVDFVPNDSLYLYWADNREANFDGNTILGYYYLGVNSLVLNPLDNLIDITPNCDSATTFFWSGGAYDFDGKSLMELDANGNVLSETDLSYNGTNFENSYKMTFTYDVNNNLISEIDQNWDGSAWENDNKYTFVYDVNNNLTAYNSQSWDNVASDWENGGKFTYTYDANNNWTSEIDEYWDNVSNTWQNTWKYIFQYTGDDRTAHIEQNWNSGTTAWENSFKIAYSYGSGGERTEDLSQDWSTGTNSWENDSKVQYTYDAGGHNTSIIFQEWSVGAWVEENQVTYVYWGDQVASIVFANWDAVSNSFVNVNRLLGTYNSYDQLTEFKIEEWNLGDFWENQSGDPKFIFYYEEYDDGVGIDPTHCASATDFLLYPNPSKNQLTIDAGRGKIGQMQIIDINGKIVFQSKKAMNASKVTIPTQNLANGIYMLKLNGNDQSGNKTFVVKR